MSRSTGGMNHLGSGHVLLNNRPQSRGDITEESDQIRQNDPEADR